MTDLSTKIVALRERFIRRCAQDADRIAGADRETLEVIAHRLSGMAGMFGCDAAGDDARALEDAIRAEAPDATVAALATSLEANLRAL